MESDQLASLDSFSLARNIQGKISSRNENFVVFQCGTGVKRNYDTLAHLYALILILGLSTLACGFPLISQRARKNSGTGVLIFFSQHFGTGVLIATAFVHLLPTAFMSLTHPCLGSFFNKKYTSLAGLIAMVSALTVVGLEMFLTLKGGGSSHSHSHFNEEVQSSQFQRPNFNKKGVLKKIPLNKIDKLPLCQRSVSLQDLEASERLMVARSPLPSTITAFSKEISNSSESSENEDLDFHSQDTDPTIIPSFSEGEMMDEIAIEDSLNGIYSHQALQKRQILQCFMLEAGILFHSIFIGMALSVATGPSFVIFLIAISFHQSFEGLALGSRIAAIEFSSRSPRPWLMVLAYGITTPIGQGIGMVMHNMYDPESVAGLLMVGVMNGISSGLLLYAGLVQLLAEDFLSSKSYDVLKGKQRLKAFSSVLAGSLSMALVGIWA